MHFNVLINQLVIVDKHECIYSLVCNITDIIYTNIRVPHFFDLLIIIFDSIFSETNYTDINRQNQKSSIAILNYIVTYIKIVLCQHNSFVFSFFYFITFLQKILFYQTL